MKSTHLCWFGIQLASENCKWKIETEGLKDPNNPEEKEKMFLNEVK
jgi:hypothetical protein